MEKPSFSIPHLSSFFQIHEYRQRASAPLFPTTQVRCSLPSDHEPNLSGPVVHLVKNGKPLNAKGRALLRRKVGS